MQMEKNESLKRKIHDFIVKELQIDSLSRDRRTEQRTKVNLLMNVLDEKRLELLEHDAKKARRLDDRESADAAHARLRKLIDAMTKVQFPSIDTMGTRFELEWKGVLWSDDFEERCDRIDNSWYTCTDPSHVSLYSEKFKILAVDGSTVYEHVLDSEVESLEHCDGWVFVKVNLDDSLDLKVSQLHWKLLSKDFNEFVKWLQEAHMIVYNFCAHGARGENPYPKEKMWKLLENRLSDALLEFYRSDDDDESNTVEDK